jgi:hypothetical protein
MNKKISIKIIRFKFIKLIKNEKFFSKKNFRGLINSSNWLIDSTLNHPLYVCMPLSMQLFYVDLIHFSFKLPTYFLFFMIIYECNL